MFICLRADPVFAFAQGSSFLRLALYTSPVCLARTVVDLHSTVLGCRFWILWTRCCRDFAFRANVLPNQTLLARIKLHMVLLVDQSKELCTRGSATNNRRRVLWLEVLAHMICMTFTRTWLSTPLAACLRP